MAIGMSPVKGEVISEQVANTMTFSQAVEKLAEGRMIHKLEWASTAYYGVMNKEQLMLHKPDNKLYQWILSHADLVGDDWIVLPE